MNEKKQAIILVSLIFLMLLGAHLFHSREQEKRIAKLTVAVASQRLKTIIAEAHEHAFLPYHKEMLRLLKDNHAMLAAFAKGDRDGLYEAARQDYEALRHQNPFFHVMNFHAPDSTSLLRMHRPDFFGDNLAGVRPIIDSVHTRQLLERGFEIGRHGLFYRIVQPVFVDQHYIGALEFGIRAEQLIELIKARVSEEVSPYYVAKLWHQATYNPTGNFSRKGNYVVSTEENSLSRELSAGFLARNADDEVIKISGSYYQIHNLQIFKSFNNEIIGGLFVFQNINNTIQQHHQFLWKYVLIALLVFLTTIGILYHFFDRIIGTLLKEIASRKKAEMAVSAKEERIRLLMNSTAEGIYGLDLEGRCCFVNQSFLTILGYENEGELLGKNLHELIHFQRPDGTIITGADCPMCRAYKDGQEVHVADEVLWRKDGTAVPVEYHAHPVYKNKCLQGAVVSFIDISKRRKVEEEMRRLAVAIENSADEIVITNLDGVIEYVNPSFERVTGYCRAEAIGRRPAILKSGKHSEAYYQDLWQTISAGKVWSDRIINKRKDGVLIEEDATISPIFDSKNKPLGYVAVKRDITEKMVMEEQLRHAQKMEAIGTLAGGIAHDFNNILSGIMGFTTLSLQELQPDSDIASNLKEVMGAAEKAKALVKHILAFSRKATPEKGQVLVQKIAREVLALSRSTLPSTIRIEEHIDMDLPPVWGDAAQIHQVIMNLVTNAFHAMRLQGGVLEIDLHEVMHGAVNDGASSIVVRIADSGCGIDQETMTHIFDPYFTTKKQGEGTGLGLATVHGIIKSHGGAIRAESEPGKGSVFTVTLPTTLRDEASHDPALADRTDSAQFAQMSSHALFVDDEPLNVSLGEKILGLVGCQVSAMTNSREALAMFKAAPHSFDLVVTDQTMPEITGIDMAKEMLQIRPDIPIIMVTGHSDLVDEETAIQAGIREFLMKPIDVRQLTDAIVRVSHSSTISPEAMTAAKAVA